MISRRLLAALLAAVSAWLVVRVGLLGLPDVPLAQLPPRDLATLLAGIPAALALWVWMLADYLRHRPEHFRIFWGLALLLGLHLGAVAYCLAVYLPRGGARSAA
jgi:hypothetical protein